MKRIIHRSTLLRFAAMLLVGGSLSLVAGCYAGAGVSTGVAVNTAYYPQQAGSVWVEGHWQWTDYGWQWSPGYWVAERPGYAYVQGYWDYHGSSWLYRPGYFSPYRNGRVYVSGNWRPYRRGHAYDYRNNRWVPRQSRTHKPRHRVEVRDHRSNSNRHYRSRSNSSRNDRSHRSGPRRRDHR